MLYHRDCPALDALEAWRLYCPSILSLSNALLHRLIEGVL